MLLRALCVILLGDLHSLSGLDASTYRLVRRPPHQILGTDVWISVGSIGAVVEYLRWPRKVRWLF